MESQKYREFNSKNKEIIETESSNKIIKWI